MVILQAAAAIAIGFPYPGGHAGTAFLAGPKQLEVEGLAYVKAESQNYWLVNDKGYVVKRFPATTDRVGVVEWLEGKSLPIGYTAVDPRATVTTLPVISVLQSWMDVVALGMRFAQQNKVPVKPVAKGLLVLFLSSYGPADHLYTSRLNLLFSEAEKAGIEVLALFSGKQETKAAVARFVALHDLRFPCALDAGNAYADAFRAARTPEAFLLSKDMRVVYSGAIDDSTFGGDAAKPYLLNAIREYANGRAVSNAATRVFGTPIDR